MDPQAGPNGIVTVVNPTAGEVERAIDEDEGRKVRSAAGRAKQPPTGL